MLSAGRWLHVLNLLLIDLLNLLSLSPKHCRQLSKMTQLFAAQVITESSRLDFSLAAPQGRVALPKPRLRVVMESGVKPPHSK
jgi:hypothetical protein